MSGRTRSARRRSVPVKASRAGSTVLEGQTRALLAPPSGLEARLLDVGTEELLVFRIPISATEERTDLTDAERDVAASILAGLSNSEIGRRRGTSDRTVANQVATIFRKLGVGSRAELVRRLVRRSEQ